MKTKIFVGVILIILSSLLASHFTNDEKTSLVDRINSSPQVRWRAGENNYFKGRSTQQIKSIMGTLQTPEEFKLQRKVIEPLKDLPTQFDSRLQWSNCESIKQVRDQSTCGSCWAFAAVQAMSDRICIASGQKLQTRISSEDLLSCCGITCGMGCNGGYPHSAWTYYKNTGISSGWLWNTTQWCRPYSFPPCDHHTTGRFQPCGASKPTPKCQKKCVSEYKVDYSKDLHHAKQIYSISKDVKQIQTQIMTNGPVEASFTVYEDFLTYKNGVYHHVEGKSLGGHSIKIIGWGEQNGMSYWLVANSWNEDWGDKGFFKIKRGSNECGIQASIVAGIPSLI